MTTPDPAATLSSLRAQQTTNPLSILNLAEPIISSSTASSNQKQQQEASQHELHSNLSPNTSSRRSVSDIDADPSLTPASLQADLTHYKDLFSKLRFSYLEQVTKEKYLRSIVGDPPLIASHEENLALETKLAGMKAEVKARKDEVDALVAEMESLARDLALRYERVNADMRVLETLPVSVEQLRREVEELKAEVREKQGVMSGGKRSDDPRMNMSLEATEAALEEQRMRNREIDRHIEELQKSLPAKIREVEKVDRELAELERRRNESTRAAREVQRRREEGGRDELEDMGRWYRSSESVLRGLLDIKG